MYQNVKYSWLPLVSKKTHYKCPIQFEFLEFWKFQSSTHTLPSTLVPSDRGGTKWLSAISSLSHTPIGTEWTCPVPYINCNDILKRAYSGNPIWGSDWSIPQLQFRELPSIIKMWNWLGSRVWRVGVFDFGTGRVLAKKFGYREGLGRVVRRFLRQKAHL